MRSHKCLCATRKTQTYTRLCNDIVLNELKKLDTQYNSRMQKIHNPVIEENHKVMGDIRVIQIVEHEYDKIQWVCSTSIYTDAG